MAATSWDGRKCEGRGANRQVLHRGVDYTDDSDHLGHQERPDRRDEG